MHFFDKDVDWIAAFRGYISRESLADPDNPAPHKFVSTMMLEAGLQEFDDQVVGQSMVANDGLTWANLTRDIVTERAERLRDSLIKSRSTRRKRSRSRSRMASNARAASTTSPSKSLSE